MVNKLGISVWRLPGFTQSIAQAKMYYASFEELTDIVLATRKTAKGLWKQFKSDAPDAALHSNIKVFLAGRLEATTSFAVWAVSRLARNTSAQEKVFEVVKDVQDYTPETLRKAKYLGHVLDETLRLTPSLYFLPRRATADILIETADGRVCSFPTEPTSSGTSGTPIVMDDHRGIQATGYPALDFVPERWADMEAQGRGSKEILHFGFGHGPRVCPGKHLGQLEVGLVVGAFVKVFKFKAENRDNHAKAGVSTKPLDGTLVELELRC